MPRRNSLAPPASAAPSRRARASPVIAGRSRPCVTSSRAYSAIPSCIVASRQNRTPSAADDAAIIPQHAAGEAPERMWPTKPCPPLVASGVNMPKNSARNGSDWRFASRADIATTAVVSAIVPSAVTSKAARSLPSCTASSERAVNHGSAKATAAISAAATTRCGPRKRGTSRDRQSANCSFAWAVTTSASPPHTAIPRIRIATRAWTG